MAGFGAHPASGDATSTAAIVRRGVHCPIVPAMALTYTPTQCSCTQPSLSLLSDEAMMPSVLNSFTVTCTLWCCIHRFDYIEGTAGALRQRPRLQQGGVVGLAGQPTAGNAHPTQDTLLARKVPLTP